MAIVAIRESFHGKKLSDAEKEDITKSVQAQKWEPGTYVIEDGNVRYVGLFDEEIPDGIHIIKAEGKWTKEWWLKGARVKYENLTEEEALEHKK